MVADQKHKWFYQPTNRIAPSPEKNRHLYLVDQSLKELQSKHPELRFKKPDPTEKAKKALKEFQAKQTPNFNADLGDVVTPIPTSLHAPVKLRQNNSNASKNRPEKRANSKLDFLQNAIKEMEVIDKELKNNSKKRIESPNQKNVGIRASQKL